MGCLAQGILSQWLLRPFHNDLGGLLLACAYPQSPLDLKQASSLWGHERFDVQLIHVMLGSPLNCYY